MVSVFVCVYDTQMSCGSIYGDNVLSIRSARVGNPL